MLYFAITATDANGSEKRQSFYEDDGAWETEEDFNSYCKTWAHKLVLRLKSYSVSKFNTQAEMDRWMNEREN